MSLVGGVWMQVPQGVRVQVSGFSLVGGTSIAGGPEPGTGAPVVHVRAFSLVGGVRIRRSAAARQGQQPPQDRWERRRERRRARQ